MSDKTHHATTSREAKPGKHGAFKHVAEPATIAEVLRAYGLSAAEFRRVQADVRRRLAKKPAHAR
jgi:hypothetical protein